MMQGTGFIAVAAREAYEKARKEAEKTAKQTKVAAEKAILAALQLHTRTLMMRIWKIGVSIDIITDVIELPKEEVETFIAAFERGKTYFDANERISIKKMMEITGLVEELPPPVP
jgi:hypothetical protein